jgi:outer membrane protein assembly factor BamA
VGYLDVKFGSARQAMRFRRALVSLAAAAVVSSVGFAAPQALAGRLDEPITRSTEDAEAASDALKQGKDDEDNLLAVPLPIVDPSIGNGLALVGLYTFPSLGADETVPRSTVAVAAGYTDTETWMLGGGFKLYLDEDRYRLGLSAGYGSINLDYYGIGDDSIFANDPVGYNVSGSFVQAAVQFRIAESAYIGFESNLIDANLKTDQLLDILPALSVDFTLFGIGPTFEYDNRDQNWWPTSGTLATATLLQYDEAIGSDASFWAFDARMAKYWSPFTDMVLAAELRAARTSDDAPFFMAPFIDVRGFPSGQYLDSALGQAQAEFRWNPFGRFGVVAFAGVGVVANDLSSLPGSDGELGFGSGLRYRISEEDQMNIGVDLALGGDDLAIYFRIGEAF